MINIGRLTEEDELWQDLVISIMAVNGFSLERMFGYAAAFKQIGLCDPRNLASWDQSEIKQKLIDAGFNRGRFMTTAFAMRLSALDKFALKSQCVEPVEPVCRAVGSSSLMGANPTSD